MVKLAKCQIEIQFIRATAILSTSIILFKVFTYFGHNKDKISSDFQRDFSEREIRSILSVQLVMLIDESGDLGRDLAN